MSRLFSVSFWLLRMAFSPESVNLLFPVSYVAYLDWWFWGRAGASLRLLWYPHHWWHYLLNAALSTKGELVDCSKVSTEDDLFPIVLTQVCNTGQLLRLRCCFLKLNRLLIIMATSCSISRLGSPGSSLRIVYAIDLSISRSSVQ